MKQIKLFGDLVKFKSDWSLEVATVAEAVRAIEANRPGFVAAASAGDYVLILADLDNPDNTRQVTIDNALDPWGDETLLVVPKASGDVPVAVVAAALSISATGFAAMAITFVLNMAISLAINMIVSLISGSNDGTKATNQEAPENKPSYLFNGVVNTTRQGHRIPLLYGQLMVGSSVLSSQVHVKDIPV